MRIQHFFDSQTFTLTYIVIDEDTKRCAIIDSVLDFDPASGRTHTTSADQIIEYVHDNHLSCDWILETHVHADHISAAPYLQENRAKIAIGNHIVDVQGIFAELFNAEPESRDGSSLGSYYRRRLIQVGGLTLNAMHTPGHTPACMSYQIEDAVFVGDTLFQPDFGTARCDFPGGSAETLWDSVQKFCRYPTKPEYSQATITNPAAARCSTWRRFPSTRQKTFTCRAIRRALFKCVTK